MRDPRPLCDMFLARVRAPERWMASAELEGALADLLAAGRSAWPHLALAEAGFVGHVARLLPDGADAAALRGLRGADLYLACACADNVPGAIEAFDQHILGRVPAFLARMSPSAQMIDEVRQVLRERFFVAAADGTRKIADYAGRGDLVGWVRVAAVRTALDLVRAAGEQAAVGDPDMTAALPAEGDMETAYLKDRYQAEFRDAFEQALAGLSSEQRNYLRLHFVDGLSTRQIGALFQVNQSTATRWLGAARQALFDATRRLLRERLPLSDSDFVGLARVVYSQMDMSISSYLRKPE